jgi:hypothetical protein
MEREMSYMNQVTNSSNVILLTKVRTCAVCTRVTWSEAVAAPEFDVVISDKQPRQPYVQNRSLECH